MATTDAGVISWCGDHWGKRLTAADGLPSSTVYSIAHDEHGSLWLGTTAGICRARDQDVRLLGGRTRPPGGEHSQAAAGEGRRHVGRHRRQASPAGTAHRGDSGNRSRACREAVRSLAEDSAGRLWMAVDAVGVVSFDGDRFSVMSTETELGTDRVWTVKVGARGDLLIGTDYGLWIEPTEPGGDSQAHRRRAGSALPCGALRRRGRRAPAVGRDDPRRGPSLPGR